MVGIEEINQRLAEIKEAIGYLNELSEELIENRDKFLLGRYFLQTMLEAMFSIGNQIISNNNLRKPGSYKDIISILVEANIIGKETGKKLTPFADLRNRLVHTYWKISQKELLEIAKDLSPFTNYLEEIVTYIKK